MNKARRSEKERRSGEKRSNEVELADSIYAYLEKANEFPEHLISKELAVEIIGKLMLEARQHDIIKVLFALNNKYLNEKQINSQSNKQLTTNKD